MNTLIGLCHYKLICDLHNAVTIVIIISKTCLITMMRSFVFFTTLCSTVVAQLLPFRVQYQDELRTISDIKVPVQLGVMSRCPDALLCESTFNEVLSRVIDKVDFSLVYIAKINDSEPDFGVSCMHGSEECAGNVQQLCVKKYAPFKNWWEFVICQDYQGREYIGGADVALKCAHTAGINWETSGAGQCAGLDGSGKGSEGVALLKESVLLTEQMNVKKSCTIVINGRAVCVHDETWKKCERGHHVNDFVEQIEEEYERLNNK